MAIFRSNVVIDADGDLDFVRHAHPLANSNCDGDRLVLDNEFRHFDADGDIDVVRHAHSGAYEDVYIFRLCHAFIYFVVLNHGFCAGFEHGHSLPHDLAYCD